jgi:hypothetical protein
MSGLGEEELVKVEEGKILAIKRPMKRGSRHRKSKRSLRQRAKAADEPGISREDRGCRGPQTSDSSEETSPTAE